MRLEGALVAAATLALAPVAGAPRAVAPLTVTATLQPQTIAFGDPVTAVVEVDAAPGTSGVVATPSFLPFTETSVDRHGNVTRYSLSCLTDGCLPLKGARLVRLRPVVASAQLGGRRVRATAAWPVLRVTSRLGGANVSRAHFERPAAPPTPRYAVSPVGLAAGLLAGAVLCVLAACALVVVLLLGRRRRAAEKRQLSGLELAIAFVRDSTRRSAADRRRALELLAEEVEPALAGEAADEAWSAAPPTPAAAAELADRAEGIRG